MNLTDKELAQDMDREILTSRAHDIEEGRIILLSGDVRVYSFKGNYFRLEYDQTDQPIAITMMTEDQYFNYYAERTAQPKEEAFNE